jgi:hypothetical protein
VAVLSPVSPSGSDPEINPDVASIASTASPSSPPASGSSPNRDFTDAFRTGELVEVFTDSVRALARIRETSDAGRLHIAFEMGEYLPWVDAAVLIRHAPTSLPPPADSDVQGSIASGPARVTRPCTARILHAGTSTALLQLLRTVDDLPPARAPYDTLPLLGD